MLPDLTWSVWLLCSSLVISGLLVAWAYPHWIRPLSMSELVSGVAGFLTWVLLLRLLSPLARAFLRSCVTLGDRVMFTLARNSAMVAKEIGGTSRAEVRFALRHLIEVEIGQDVGAVKPETRFPDGVNISQQGATPSICFTSPSQTSPRELPLLCWPAHRLCRRDTAQKDDRAEGQSERFAWRA